MEIERENDIDKVFFSFRIKLSQKKFDLIKDFLDVNFEYEINRTKSLVIVIIDFEKSIITEKIKILLNDYNLKLNEVDIFIGITSSYDMGGLSVPQSVLNIIRDIECDLHFSYVVC